MSSRSNPTIRQLRLDIKKINTRIKAAKKSGFASLPGIKYIESLKYSNLSSLIGTDASGATKLRTDLSNFTLKQLDAMQKQVDHILNEEITTKTEAQYYVQEQKRLAKEYADEYPDDDGFMDLDDDGFMDLDDDEFMDLDEETEDEAGTIDDDYIREYLEAEEKVMADAYTKAFYLDGQISELRLMTLQGSLDSDKAAEIAKARLISAYMREEHTEEGGLYDEDIRRLFY